MNLTNSSRVIKSPHHFTHHSTFSSINILSFKILEIWWLTVKMADKTQICLFAYIGKMLAKIWKIKEIWLMQRDAEGFREMQRDEQRWREMQRDAERYRHYGRYARFWEVVITDGGTDKTQGFRVELQVSGRGGGVIGTGSPCEYSVCTHPLLQFYACLHQTGQVVRYSRLHPFTSVDWDVELDNKKMLCWKNAFVHFIRDPNGIGWGGILKLNEKLCKIGRS